MQCIMGSKLFFIATLVGGGVGMGDGSSSPSTKNTQGKIGLVVNELLTCFWSIFK